MTKARTAAEPEVTPGGTRRVPGEIFSRTGARPRNQVKPQTPVFDGEPSVAAFDFIEDLQDYAAICGYTEEDFRMDVVPQTLKGNAKIWWRAQPFYEWQPFKVAFLKAYLPGRYVTVMRAEMDICYQDTNEPLVHFVAIINRYFDIAKPEATQFDRVAKIVSLANPNFTRAMENRTFATVAALLHQAPEIEKLVLKEQDYRRPPPPHQLTTPSMGWKGTDPFSHVAAIYHPKKESKNDGEKDKQSKQQHGSKNSSGHRNENSSHKKHGGQHQKPSPAGPTPKGTAPAAKPSPVAKAAAPVAPPTHNRCFKCDKEGHRIAECPEAKKEQAAKN